MSRECTCHNSALADALAEVADLRAKLEQAERERDEARAEVGRLGEVVHRQEDYLIRLSYIVGSPKDVDRLDEVLPLILDADRRLINQRDAAHADAAEGRRLLERALPLRHRQPECVLGCEWTPLYPGPMREEWGRMNLAWPHSDPFPDRESAERAIGAHGGRLVRRLVGEWEEVK